jgi:hypothetical protein
MGAEAGHALSHDPFSDGEFSGRIRGRDAPVEMVPILSTIFVLNQYFLKRPVLIRKKPCNLAAFFSA